MKQFCIIFMVSLLLFAAPGCRNGDRLISSGLDMDVELLRDPTALPEEQQEAVSVLTQQRGWFQLDSHTIGVSLGERPTDGYELKVLHVKLKEDLVEVVVEETVPGDDELVTQALTYPFVLIRFAQSLDDLTLRVWEYMGDDFADISAETVSAEGIFEGARHTDTGRSAEIRIGEQTHSFIYDLGLESAFAEMLNAGDEVSIRYITGSDGTRYLTYINLQAREAMHRGQEGIFIGLADGHTMEIDVDGQPLAFAFAEQILIGQFEPGDRVLFDWYDDGDRLVITRMEPVN